MHRLAIILALLASVTTAHKDPNYVVGPAGTMVHLFEWKWSDVAKECERFLGPVGFGGVQVSPIQENVIVSPLKSNHTWRERYMPISYRIATRSGNEEEFRDMVRRCNSAGVRVYVDAVFNHMTGDHKVAVGTGNSTANTYKREYPAVPYSSSNFHEACIIDDYQNPRKVRDCELNGLHDLDQTDEHVRGKIVDFMNAAIDAGVAGFKIDAAMNMWPNDLKAIYSRTKNLSSEHGFANGSRAFVFHDVIQFGEEGISKYEYDFGAVTEYSYGSELSYGLKGRFALKWLFNWGVAWKFLPSKDALVFVDNHDTQRTGRSGGLTHQTPRLYKMAVAFMLAHPHGLPLVMSSYDFNSEVDGPPSDEAGNILSPVIRADGSCRNGWVCEHRWRQIYNMVRFRNAAGNATINEWWDNDSRQIAFCRGDRAFVAINGEYSKDLKRTLKVCLPAGVYCDVISGDLVNGTCTGKTVNVTSNGTAFIDIPWNAEDGVLAIHRNAKLRQGAD